jgi:hypothetical protein
MIKIELDNSLMVDIEDALSRVFPLSANRFRRAIADAWEVEQAADAFGNDERIPKAPIKCWFCGYERTVWNVCPNGCDTSTLIPKIQYPWLYKEIKS